MYPGSILIVDDAPDITEATIVVLESKSYEVRSASNGADAIVRPRETRPGLMILNVWNTC